MSAIASHLLTLNKARSTMLVLLLLKEKLKDMYVYWEQPWYQQHSTLSRPPQFETIDESNMYLTNTLCQDERNRIEKNWRKLIRRFGIPDKLASLCRWKNLNLSRKTQKIRVFVVAWLARGLKRNLYQVHKHIIAYYGTVPKGNRYVEMENKVVEMCFYHMPKGAARIASDLLGREPRQIYAKLQVLNGKEKLPQKRLYWKLPLASKFLRDLLKCSELSIEELKYRRLDRSVWLKLQESMEHSYLYLQEFWYSCLHVQLFVDCDIKMYRIKKRILKILRAKNYKIWGDIRWTEIIEELPDGVTNKFVYHLVHKILGNYPNYRYAPLEDVLSYGFTRIKPLKLKDKRLRRLTFRDGMLEKIVNGNTK